MRVQAQRVGCEFWVRGMWVRMRAMISEGRWRGGRVDRVSDGGLSVEADRDAIVALESVS